MKTKAILLFALLALAAFVAGCGSDGATYSSIDADSSSQSADNTSDDSSDDTSSDDSDDSSSGKTVMPKVTGSAGKEPKISDASGTPPTKLVKKDIIKGTGKTAKSGDKVSVQYVGHNWSNNEEFDGSWGRGEPFEFTLGEGAVIQGWDQGVAGMKVGGRRLLIIPPDLGYGEQGQGSIPANETLIFVVDLEKVS